MKNFLTQFYPNNLHTLSKFDKYYELLIEWNNKFNLTAITEKNDVILKHFIDSIMGEKYIQKNSSVIDIGSGAGFPSIPLKIMRDDLECTLVDSLNKRVTFLNEVISSLDLKNITAIHSRAEDLDKNKKYDYAVARAVASLNTLCEYCLPFVKVGGYFLAYKGGNIEEELNNSKNAIKILGGQVEKVYSFNLYNSDNARTIVAIKKIAPTPPKYPRGKNLPKTKPLI